MRKGEIMSTIAKSKCDMCGEEVENWADNEHWIHFDIEGGGRLGLFAGDNEIFWPAPIDFCSWGCLMGMIMRVQGKEE
jgi:hypothetical protein